VVGSLGETRAGSPKTLAGAGQIGIDLGNCLQHRCDLVGYLTADYRSKPTRITNEEPPRNHASDDPVEDAG